MANERGNEQEVRELQADMTPAELEALGAMPLPDLRLGLGLVFVLFLVLCLSGWIWRAYEARGAQDAELRSGIAEVMQAPLTTPGQVDTYAQKWNEWHKDVDNSYAAGSERKARVQAELEAVRLKLVTGAAEQLSHPGGLEIADELRLASAMHTLEVDGTPASRVIIDSVVSRVRLDGVRWLATLAKSNDRDDLARGVAVAQSLRSLSDSSDALDLDRIVLQLDSRMKTATRGTGQDRLQVAENLGRLYDAAQGVTVGTEGADNRTILVRGVAGVTELAGPIVGTENVRQRLREIGFTSVDVHGTDGRREFDLASGNEIGGAK